MKSHNTYLLKIWGNHYVFMGLSSSNGANSAEVNFDCSIFINIVILSSSSMGRLHFFIAAVAIYFPPLNSTPYWTLFYLARLLSLLVSGSESIVWW
jgi:hypothetical protein